jgi:hypothetical protein
MTRYLVVIAVCGALALCGCKTPGGAGGGAPDGVTESSEVDPAAKVENIEQKVEGLKKKKTETEKRVKDLEHEVKKTDPAPAP